MTDTQNNFDIDLKYYMFDWDDNILHMPTSIYLEKNTGDEWVPHTVTTAEFAIIRNDTDTYRAPGGDWDKAFVEFHDQGDRGENAFLDDTRRAIDRVMKGEDSPAPSFEKFRLALSEGRLFAIITARAHGAAAIRRGVEYFIETVLTPEEKSSMLKQLHKYSLHFDGADAAASDEEVLDEYLSINRYQGVTSPRFQEEMGIEIKGAESPEFAKQLAIQEFVSHVLSLVDGKAGNLPVSVGFSDDDAHNVQSIERYLREEISERHPDVKFVIYDTSDAKHPIGRKIVIQGDDD